MENYSQSRHGNLHRKNKNHPTVISPFFPFSSPPYYSSRYFIPFWPLSPFSTIPSLLQRGVNVLKGLLWVRLARWRERQRSIHEALFVLSPERREIKLCACEINLSCLLLATFPSLSRSKDRNNGASLVNCIYTRMCTIRLQNSCISRIYYFIILLIFSRILLLHRSMPLFSFLK